MYPSENLYTDTLVYASAMPNKKVIGRVKIAPAMIAILNCDGFKFANARIKATKKHQENGYFAINWKLAFLPKTNNILEINPVAPFGNEYATGYGYSLNQITILIQALNCNLSKTLIKIFVFLILYI
jgi:hypothetical protein